MNNLPELLVVVNYVLQQPYNFFCVAAQYTLSTVTVNAEGVDHSTPAVRVTWRTTVPPECVASVKVDFRTGSHSGDLVATYRTINTSKTEFIQIGLQCITYYYVSVVVTGATSDGVRPALSSRPVQVFTGEIYHDISCNHSNMTVCHLHRYTTAIRTDS